MRHDGWLEIMSRASVPQVAEIAPAFRSPAAMAALASDAETGLPGPSSMLWPCEDAPRARFGVRVRTAPADPRRHAVRLAAASMERGAEPVILSYVGRSGFEQAGFRVERIHGGTEAECGVQELEVSRFWGLSIIIDFDDISALD